MLLSHGAVSHLEGAVKSPLKTNLLYARGFIPTASSHFSATFSGTLTEKYLARWLARRPDGLGPIANGGPSRKSGKSLGFCVG